MTSASRRSGASISALLILTLLASWEFGQSQSGSAFAAETVLGSSAASADLKPGAARAETEIEAARAAVAAEPLDETPVRILVEALTRAGRDREALAAADLFAKRGTASAALRAQRGYLRRGLGDLAGTIDDFAAALASSELTADQRRNLEAGLSEAQGARNQDELNRAQSDLASGDFARAAGEALLVLKSNPDSGPAMRIRVEALARSGRKGDALTESNRLIQGKTADPQLRAQRGFLRRELRDSAGAAEDFSAALAGDGLSEEQRQNVEAGLAEARIAARQTDYDRAQAALTRGDFKSASAIAGRILERDPNSEAAMLIRIDALTRAGNTREAAAETDRLIARGHATGAMLARRGFARADAGDLQGATQDFAAALGRGGLDRQAASNIRHARTKAIAMLAEHEGNPQAAEASYREALQVDPSQADTWYDLGYLMLQEGRRAQGADALTQGLALRPVGPAFFDAANAYILTSAPLASKLYRAGLDRWYAGDPSLATRSPTDLEHIKNEVVDADASIRTTVAAGGIAARPEAAGGTNDLLGVDSRVRFDGRHLPSVPGLEAFARGLTDKDANGIRETEAGIGLRYRPFSNLNLYVGGLLDQFFQPSSETELVAIWGLGLGADAYPYATGWKPYWDFGTFGAWRTADARVLEDVRANVGVMYDLRAPVRGAIGPTLLAVAGYDNQAAVPLAAGIGPSVLAYFWLGGDKYRSYDAVLTVQAGYLVNVGDDARQSGWRGQVGVTF